jgi:hypothetical protein
VQLADAERRDLLERHVELGHVHAHHAAVAGARERIVGHARLGRHARLGPIGVLDRFDVLGGKSRGVGQRLRRLLRDHEQHEPKAPRGRLAARDRLRHHADDAPERTHRGADRGDGAAGLGPRRRRHEHDPQHSIPAIERLLQLVELAGRELLRQRGLEPRCDLGPRLGDGRGGRAGEPLEHQQHRLGGARHRRALGHRTHALGDRIGAGQQRIEGRGGHDPAAALRGADQRLHCVCELDDRRHPHHPREALERVQRPHQLHERMGMRALGRRFDDHEVARDPAQVLLGFVQEAP